ncbi:hypothetical protein KP509_20G092500 [Ceratopteris richardii]|uniref:Uncharacterized protein n=1 Tax=Ceratopteris richardii TaxID=49495 RepID=A0A8T2SKT8_CERRI|nr:hypothetical protein KP509_20G092500 [Ceratopteris richardii]
MSSHSHRCIIHPNQPRVGVCALCLRERLLALVQESECSNGFSSDAAAAAASDGGSRSSSSSSSPRYHVSSPPMRPPPKLRPQGQSSTKSQPPIAPVAPSPTSLMQKLKLRALISIPPSPDRAVSRTTAGLTYSPTPRNLRQRSRPITGRKSLTSEFSSGAPLPRLSNAGSRVVVLEEPDHSLKSLFAQNVSGSAPAPAAQPSAAENCASDYVEQPRRTFGDERRQRIDQFSASMQAAGFSHLNSKSPPVLDTKLGYESGCEQNKTRSNSSWIASLFHRKKKKESCRPNMYTKNAEVQTMENPTFEASARTSIDYARASIDSASTALKLKQIIRSRMQQEEEASEVIKQLAVARGPHDASRTAAAADLMDRGYGKPKIDQQHQAANDMSSDDGYEFPRRTSVSIGSTITVSGSKISSTARIGVNDSYSHPDDGHFSDGQARHFPRSRSVGRHWSRVPSISSPQHVLLNASKQLQNDINLNGYPVTQKPPPVQRHCLTSTPKHPSIDIPAQESRIGFGFYFSPFRRSRRQRD